MTFSDTYMLLYSRTMYVIDREVKAKITQAEVKPCGLTNGG